jgi:hypothetical protein
MRIFFTLSIVLLVAQGTFSQSVTLAQATEMITKGELEPAIVALRSIVAGAGQLPQAEQAYAHWRLSDALLQAAKRNWTANKNALAPNYLGYLVESSQQIALAKKAMGTEPMLTKTVNEQVRKLKMELNNATVINLKTLAASEDSVANIELLDGTEASTRQTIALDSNHYQAYDYLGQVLLNKGDSATALGVFKKGVSAYAADKRTEPDISAGQMTQRLIKLQMSYLRDTVAAERTIQEAFAALEREVAQVKANTGMTEMRKTMLFDKLALSRMELKLLSLKVLTSKPKLTEEELARFTEAMERYPDDLELRVMYGKVLSHSNQVEALRYYEGLAETAPKDFMVMYSLGAMYSARAEYFSKPENLNEKEVSRHLAKALRTFEDAEMIDSENPKLLVALIAINERLGHKSQAAFYRDKLNSK